MIFNIKRLSQVLYSHFQNVKIDLFVFIFDLNLEIIKNYIFHYSKNKMKILIFLKTKMKN